MSTDDTVSTLVIVVCAFFAGWLAGAPV